MSYKHKLCKLTGVTPERRRWYTQWCLIERLINWHWRRGQWRYRKWILWCFVEGSFRGIWYWRLLQWLLWKKRWWHNWGWLSHGFLVIPKRERQLLSCVFRACKKVTEQFRVQGTGNRTQSRFLTEGHCMKGPGKLTSRSIVSRSLVCHFSNVVSGHFLLFYWIGKDVFYPFKYPLKEVLQYTKSKLYSGS